MSRPGFWEDRERAVVLSRKQSEIQRKLDMAEQVDEAHGELVTLLELDKEGENVEEELENFHATWADRIHKLEITIKLTGKDDHRNAIVSIHPGAGGTESQDWAAMLMRMFLRWAESNAYKTSLIEYLDGEEAGIKSVTFTVEGTYAYGYLKGEAGVHRLVRISPYDANKRRHTSFAAADVYPEVDDSIEITINEKDLRIDTFRSSGRGGQHVNVTDSAVRITHIPSNIVVSCQNERSQIKNRDVAMKILRARLYDLETRKHEEEKQKKEAEKMGIAFGSQIRSYVLHPYQMVKDHRTDVEVGDAQRVLDGEIDLFIEAYLNKLTGM